MYQNVSIGVIEVLSANHQIRPKRICQFVFLGYSVPSPALYKLICGEKHSSCQKMCVYVRYQWSAVDVRLVALTAARLRHFLDNH